ncbi:SDR family NAD(P)-dependent oxidoreductase [Streptomyces rapamycinicus]|uniref:SDR family NAD(P)-dependent oxidoreductase n=1 Tax=Streptomyces rapamycinicus TaxID=1226757 RepID=UPI0020C99C6C|nr:SDR family oxidoreductase [Streptomyces rapamycinicus]UTP28080.1 SDR family oxidoreductase [Streptomyces rapamycinicus NRRL 5491]
MHLLALSARDCVRCIYDPISFSGQTTIVTGASSGIGAAFARELARRGSDVVLVARRHDRLEALASELRTRHGVRATAIPLDLSEPGAGRRLAADLARRDITVDGLVNNAGFGTDGAFHEEDPDRLTDEINVDVANLVDLTRAFIEPLRDSGRGVLVNVASMAAYTPIPAMAVYAACKAFVLSFTEALWYESRGTGLRVLSLAPGLTRTEFFDGLGSGAHQGTYQTPEQVVTTAMRALDRGRRPSVQSGRRNALLVRLPRFTTRRRTVLLSGVISARSSGAAAAAA